MPRILIDVTRLMYRRVTGTLPTGIDRVGQEYVRRYGGDARAVMSLGPFSVTLSKRDSDQVFAAVSSWRGAARTLALRVCVKAFLWRWLALRVRGDILFNTGHTGLENPHYAWWLRRAGAHAVVFVHDLIPITHPQFCRPGELRRHTVRMGCAARVSAGIVFNSEHTLREFEAFCRDAMLRAPQGAVAGLGSGLPHAPPGERPIAAPYFVLLGTIEPRKNHRMILQVWRRLAQSMRGAAPKLVVIGQRGWGCGDVMDLLHRCDELRDVVIHEPHCGDAEVATWLLHSRALLFPSFAEGYGMPVTEALGMGVPVIASALPVFHEIAGAIPDYAQPLDADRWEALIRDYAGPDGTLRPAQMARMKSFRGTSWAQHFAVVDKLLSHLAPEDVGHRRAA